MLLALGLYGISLPLRFAELTHLTPAAQQSLVRFGITPVWRALYFIGCEATTIISYLLPSSATSC